MQEILLGAIFNHPVTDALMATLNQAYIAKKSAGFEPGVQWWSSIDDEQLTTNRNLYEAERTAVSGLMLAYAQTLVPQREARIPNVHLSLTHEGLHWCGSAYFERRSFEQPVETAKPLVPEAA